MKKTLLMLVILALMPTSTILARNDMAKVVTQHGRPADCLAPIAVYKIDGKERIVPAMGFAIEPGIHTINGRAAIDITYCRRVGRARDSTTAPDLLVNFEAGKTYYIGYDHKSHNTADWKLVVWKVEGESTQLE